MDRRMAVALAAREQTRARYPDAEGDVMRDGVRVHYEIYGRGAPTVFLLPTWSIIHSRHWKAQLPYLSRHFRVLTFDGRGNGRSDRPDEPEAYAEREFAADAVAVMDATQTERAVLVALSLGAQRGTLLAAEHPERVAGIAYIGPAWPGGGEALADRVAAGTWDEELESEDGWAKYNKHYWLRDYRGFVEFFFAKMFSEPHSTKPIEDCVGWGLETTPETLVTAQRAAVLQPREARALATRIRCPVLVIHGSDDRITSLTRGSALAEQARGELVVLEGSGHGPHARDPVAVNALLHQFVTRCR